MANTYEERYLEALDRLGEVRRERDVLVQALDETQRQLRIARATVTMYQEQLEGGDDDAE